MAHLHLAIEPEDVKTGPAPIPFPIVRASQAAATSADTTTDAPHDALLAVEAVSRRMEDLARELGCLGYFDERDDEPTAA